MFHHLLIPVDLGDRSERALDIAKDLAEPSHATVTLLHVIETIPGANFDEFQSFYAELEARAQQRLGDLASRLTSSGVDVSQEIVYGRPTEEVVRFASSRSIDLVVLSSHTVDISQPGRGWGTLSYKIGILSPCPVLLVK